MGCRAVKRLANLSKDTYDKERTDLEKQTLLETQLNENDVVTDMNREIYMMDAIIEEQEQQMIELEEYSLSFSR